MAMIRGAGLTLLAMLATGGAWAQATDLSGAFMRPERGTGSADVAVDPAGGVHMAFVHWEPSAEGGEAVYGFCAGPASNCDADPAAWSYVELVRAASHVQVAATTDGRPRLLIESEGAEGGTAFTYAECDADCGDQANWRLALLVTAHEDPMAAVFAIDEARRTFALDPEGQPQFVYSDRNYFVEPDHYGTFWMSCKATCSDPAAWVETDLARHKEYDTEVFDAPSLAIDAQGRPRLVARIFGWNEDGTDAPEGLYYLACDVGCRDVANWERVWVTGVGSGSYPSPTWSLAMDPDGRPRVALFAGDGMEVAELSHTLMYIWCDAGPECLVSDQPWFGTVIATDAVGESAALAMTPEGHPRIAFLNDGAELAFAWCDEACETEGGGTWNGYWVENQASLSAERPTAIPFTCDAELWNGLAPQLALGPDRRPIVAYDVSVQSRCLYREWGAPEHEITYEFHETWRGARMVTFAP